MHGATMCTLHHVAYSEVVNSKVTVAIPVATMYTSLSAQDGYRAIVVPGK